MDIQQIENFKIIKQVAEEDLKNWQAFREDEKKAFCQAKKEINDLKLEMKLINVHFLYQKKKIIFNFTADNRIDFRQLVKRLASIFKTRIEMRQIGVRDAAKIIGSYGVCGIVNCCLRSNCHINSIYLKMAKDQGFVVNSSKLTGSCGRLMCCLSYEAQFYNEEKKDYPVLGSVVTDGNKNYTVSSNNIIKKEVYVCDENHHQKKYPLENITYLKKDNDGVCIYKTTPELSIKPAVDSDEHAGRK
jgi:cell fate regulator YaaT (PSP1 superfamily)